MILSAMISNRCQHGERTLNPHTCRMNARILILLALTFSVFSSELLRADEMKDRVSDAIGILAEKQKSSAPIPAAVMQKAKGVAIVEVAKGGLGVSGSHGEGVLVAKTAQGWSAPS